MVVTDFAYNANLAETNEDFFSGVVKVSSNGYYGTGSLLYDGSAILTAAHIFTDTDAPTTITFQDSFGETFSFNASNVLIHPSYDTINDNADVAIVFLDEYAPSQFQRYDIYRDEDALNQDFLSVGFGVTGVGEEGYNADISTTRLKAYNSFDTDAKELKDALGLLLDWYPDENVLVADFDDGTITHDALGNLLGLYDTGLGVYEGLTAPGDSGGPAFIDSKIAGIASYVAALDSSSDVDTTQNCSYGELGFWQDVSAYQEWIDKSLRSNYQDAPTSKEEVDLTVIEGDSGSIAVAYFFVELLNAPLDRSEKVFSLDYTTQDGTAKAGEDYISTLGTLRLYDDESYALIPVEIIGDNVQEEDEYFYLEVTNPKGATFEGDVVSLSAMRVIVDDDLF